MEEASVSIRLNPFKGLAGPEGAPVPWSPYGRILADRPVFTLDPLFHAGCYYVQDSSAMFVGHLFRKLLQITAVPEADAAVASENRSHPRLRKREGPASEGSGRGPAQPDVFRGWLPGSEGEAVIRVLDLCAAPGGKTTDLAASLRERYGDRYLLVANEVMKARVKILDDNVARWGDPNVMVTSVDPAAFARMGGYFDIIVADVPCSGEGMFRKDPRAREEWSPAVVDLCASRQRRILADVWPALREGGWLLYSTCTYEAAENDDNLAWAAAELGGEILEPEAEFEEYGVRRTPHGHLLEAGVVPGEGQWAGALRKTAPQAVTAGADPAILRPLRQGLRKGETKGRDFVPDADYALSILFDRNEYNCVDVDRQTALRFLHRDALTLPQAAPGYNAVTYQGHPLGFVKNIGSRCNNLLPKDRRILMNV
jgi:16S rRNA C967 or C1407 C5-methylase (RsmB/RsmF family)